MKTRRGPRALVCICGASLALLASSGCVSAAKYDALRERNRELKRRLETADGPAPAATCPPAAGRADGQNSDERVDLRDQRDRLAAELERSERERQQQLESDRVQRQILQRRIAQLEALVRKHARRFRVSAAALRRGRFLGMRPGARPRGPLSARWASAADDTERLFLREDSIIALDGLEADSVVARVDELAGQPFRGVVEARHSQDGVEPDPLTISIRLEGR